MQPSLNQNQYTFPIGWKILFILICIFFLTASLWVIHDGLYGKMGLFGLFLGALFLCFSVYCGIRILKEKFIITNNSFIHQRAFTTRKILFDDVLGYRTDDKYIRIYTQQEKAKIMLSTYIGNKKEIMRTIAAQYPDLDVVDSARARRELLNNTDYGFTPEQVAQKLKKAKTICIGLNVSGIALGAWAFAFPQPYILVIVLNLLMPLAAIIIAKTSNGLIRINHVKTQANPNVLLAFLAPVFAVALRLLFDLHIFSFTNLWQYAGLLLLCVLGLVMPGSKEFGFTTKTMRGSTIFHHFRSNLLRLRHLKY